MGKETSMNLRISGYRRKDGAFGIRNHVLILPASVCASEVANKIATKIKGCSALRNQQGCCQLGDDLKQTRRTLVNLGKNPNVASVLVVGLGCETLQAEGLAEEIGECKPTRLLSIQDEGGSKKAVIKGIELAKDLVIQAEGIKKEEGDVSELVVALNCGGSDMTSALVSNPAVGRVTDRLVDLGASVIFGETTEIIGAEHLLSRRIADEKVKKKLLEAVRATEERAKKFGTDLRGTQPTPGNIEGGISTLEEKSLGAIAKSGSRQIRSFLEYGERVSESGGLYFMDTPGQDIEAITGMLAGGASVVLFTTGRGTPTGSSIAPVIKVTANSETFKLMKPDIDVFLGNAYEISDSVGRILENASEKIFRKLLDIANGKESRAEVQNHREFALYRIAPSF
jgi:altronate dehydratase large subunit